MIKKSSLKFYLILLANVSAFLSISTLCSCTTNAPGIEIISYLVRDRIVPLHTIEIRSTLIVGFKILGNHENFSNLLIRGKLFYNDKLISTDDISNLDSAGNNLGFDIHSVEGGFRDNELLGIPEGNYLVVIELFDERRHILAECKKELERNQIGRLFFGFDKTYESPRYIEALDPVYKLKSPHPKNSRGVVANRDYDVFQRSYMKRVYLHTEPDPSEYVSSIVIEASRNERKPFSFSIHADKDLGTVSIEVAPLRGIHGIQDSIKLRIGAVDQLTEVLKEDDDAHVAYYRWAPKIIENKNVAIPHARSQRYWLTLNVGHQTPPGDYQGIITIKPQFSHQTEIPVLVKIHPLELMDTDIQYGMMMTYAFYELDNKSWSAREKALIREGGLKIYEDFREHGMTMIYPHSHFFLKRGEDGQPILSSLRASLEAYKKFNFPGPFCWYIGHLLQTAKPFHPGSIANYDDEIAEKRLRYLLKSYEKIAKDIGISKDKLIVQLVDETDRKDRIAAGKSLNKIAQQMGFKTLVTRHWPEVDVICTTPPRDDHMAEILRKTGKAWWIYPNKALGSKNLAYVRYVFGFGAWRWGVNGVVPWTFQMTQGCNGNPFTVLDGSERMVAYPGVGGPVPTPLWETIGDGINDYKYIYQLKMLIARGKAAGNRKAFEIEQQLNQFKTNLGEGTSAEDEGYGDWPPGAFDTMRRQIVNWTLELHTMLGFDENTSG